MLVETMKEGDLCGFLCKLTCDGKRYPGLVDLPFCWYRERSLTSTVLLDESAELKLGPRWSKTVYVP